MSESFQSVLARDAANKPLALTRRLLLFSQYETGFLSDGATTIDAGRIYGDPDAGVIDAEERWCAIGGCGLDVTLAPPSGRLLDGGPPERRSFGKDFPGFWIAALWQEDARTLGIAGADAQRGLYVLDVDTLALQRTG